MHPLSRTWFPQHHFFLMKVAIEDVVVHTCNPSALWLEARESEAQGHLDLYTKSEASLRYTRLSASENKQKGIFKR